MNTFQRIITTHLQFLLQAASPETSGYTLVLNSVSKV